MARPNVYDRRNQSRVEFRLDEDMKEKLQKIVDKENVSLTVFMEELVKKEIFKRNLQSS